MEGVRRKWQVRARTEVCTFIMVTVVYSRFVDSFALARMCNAIYALHRELLYTDTCHSGTYVD